MTAKKSLTLEEVNKAGVDDEAEDRQPLSRRLSLGDKPINKSVCKRSNKFKVKVTNSLKDIRGIIYWFSLVENFSMQYF